MSHINYNHLYYFWHIYKESSVAGAAEALCLTPQIITGQIRALKERLQRKLFKRRGRGLEPSELGGLVYRYTDKTFILSQEVLDIVNYCEESDLLFDVGVADAPSKRPVNSVLDAAVAEDEQIHLRCFGLMHEMLLEWLNQYELDMIISGCPIDSTQQEGLLSMKVGECGVSFWRINPLPGEPFPACLGERRSLIPGYRSMLGCKLLNWFNSQGPNVGTLGKFDDTALMKASGVTHNATFVISLFYANDFYNDGSVMETGYVENVMKGYHMIFAERMIQHPTVQCICNTDYPVLLTPAPK